jgi:1,4-alpha-glucan branching enzyme
VMERIHPDGLFAAVVPPVTALDYELLVVDARGTVRRQRDPYAYRALDFTAEDDRLFLSGRHAALFDRLGAHFATIDGIAGTQFAVWAPAAQRVSVVGTFNDWDGRRYPMTRTGGAGVWVLFLPGVMAGDLYKYEIKTPAGAVFLKPDPFAACAEPPPGSASLVCDMAGVGAALEGEHEERPWSTATGSRHGLAVKVLTQDDLVGDAGAAIAAARSAGYSHVELPVADPGGAVDVDAGCLARGAAGGRPEALMAIVKTCHGRGLGVILPALTPTVATPAGALVWFDGTPLYEDPAVMGHPDTLNLDLRRGEIRSILRSSIAYWRRRFHADAIRIDRRVAAALGVNGDPADRCWLVVDEAAPPPLPAETLRQLFAGMHPRPHAVLGPHAIDRGGGIVIRVLVPDAEQVHVVLDVAPDVAYRMRATEAPGLFDVEIDHAAAHATYHLHLATPGRGAMVSRDAYGFRDDAFVFSDLDEHLFAAGNHYRIYERLGAHQRRVSAVPGAGFAVWAPNAQAVSVVGSFNDWDVRRHMMTLRGAGVWEIFIPELAAGALYKYAIACHDGERRLKSDPYAFAAEVPPASASVVATLEATHEWRDEAWMRRRASGRAWQEPMAIYEVHLGSWRRAAGDTSLSYRALARTLVPYVKAMGFTHIELLPVAEHPYEPSWGYQVSNFYAPTSRFGGPADLMAFVDACHAAGIGVILDWVPGHFPKDDYALARFDGTCLYEHADPRKGEHRDWGTLIFNYGRHEVENFLIANALFWLETYHFDGLRVDAVASMLYLDYSRPNPGDWIPNVYGGRENLEAIEFLKHTNVVVHRHFPGVLMIAEESTAWPNVSAPVESGGLGFGFKWNMGWMHDILHYMSTPAEERCRHHHKLTFSIVYAFNENFILALSHDEVVHLKGSLLTRMPGEEWERFANLRLLFAFMYAHPGKKLLFMGGEFAQPGEWSHARGLDWACLEHDRHRRLAGYMQSLNRLYRTEPALHEVDASGTGFEWIDPDDAANSVIAFLRKGRDPRNAVLCVFNFSGISRPNYRIGVPYPVAYRMIFASNDETYGGAGRPPEVASAAEDIGWHGRAFSIRLHLPAFGAVVLKPAPTDAAPRTLEKS